MRFKDYFTKQGLVVIPSLKTLNESLVTEQEGYGLLPVFSRNWKTSEKRLLVVLESVDRSDFAEGALLNNSIDKRGSLKNPITNALPAVLDRALRMRDDFNEVEEQANDFAFCAINFNACKSRDLPVDQQISLNFKFARRVVDAIEKLRPTHVLVCGDTAANQILEIVSPPDAALSHFKRGWVIPIKGETHSYLLTPTLDLDLVCSPPVKEGEDGGEEEDSGDRYAVADLLYFVTRNAANLVAERHLFSLEKVKTKPNVIKTIEEFNALMKTLRSPEAKLIGVDMEGASLETYHNKIYTIQFSYDGIVGHIVPVDHPHETNPFDEKERRYIKKKLRSFFAEDRPEHLKHLVLINGMFDMRVFRSLLKIKFIHHHIHEITAGESLLDENIGLFGNTSWYLNGKWVKTSYQNLAAMFALYGNMWYYRESEFGKADRHSVGRQSLESKDFIEYCAMDVVSVFHIAKMQFKRAKHTFINRGLGEAREVYYPWYKRHLQEIMKRVVVSISHMEADGSPIDIEYLRKLMGKESPITTKMEELQAAFLDFPKVKEAEDRLMQDKGRTTGSLWGDSYTSNAFRMDKKAHMETLLFDVMGLEAIAFTSTGARSIGKIFLNTYGPDHPEVKAYQEFIQASKLRSAYVKGWYKKLMGSLDSAKDFILRPSFGFFTIVTGRLNSFGPSLQQVPSRGPMAPIIHRMFAAPIGHLNIRWDYNAAEVRQASVLSGDPSIADSFKVGQKLRRMLLKAPSDKIRKMLKEKGDVHILNVKLFFNQLVDKSHPLRSAVKAVVFGVIYGKSAATLGRDLRAEEIGRLTDDLRKLRKNEELTAAEKRKKAQDIEFKMKEAEDKDWTEYAQEVIDKMFDSSPRLKKFLEDSVASVRRYGHVVSPAGRVRNLWRVFTGRSGVLAAASRRAQNSPIQGFSSESGSIAAYETLKTSDLYIKEKELDEDLFPKYSRAVHDANYFYVPYEFVLYFLHITQHVSALGLAKWYEDVMGVPFTIEPEIELEIGANDASAEAWDWTTSNLMDCIFNALKEHAAMGRLDENEIPTVFKTILQPWLDKDTRQELCERFPLLGVRDIDDQIEIGLQHARGLVAEWKKKRKAA